MGIILYLKRSSCVLIGKHRFRGKRRISFNEETLERPSQRNPAKIGDHGDAGRLPAVHRNHENDAQGKARKEARFPRPGFFFLVGSLTCREFGIRQTLSNNLRHNLNESPSIVAIVAVIEPEYLLCNI